ncbi:ABC transporter permease [Glycomyces harbinensis]|uniref:ABC-2 type transport system permease protein n=1 Tax=Glycomyces harbinensis TaxID=58114 RepID=A0A1G7BQB6_9ACTN|nr:ABC transporter permease [Glycomyces harbinensis]SDE29331.1 ABC-2 type transport system permease protein [Glycomyces harbinensis]
MTTAAAEIEDGLGTLAGTGKLLRFYLRRTRIFLIGWLGGMFAFSALMAVSLPELYPDAAARAEGAALLDTPAMRFMTGPSQYIDAYGESVGAMFAHQILMWSLAVTGVMFILLVTRLTRADEETSRSEVVRSLPVGRRADLAAALLLSLIAAVALGALITLSVMGLEGTESSQAVLYGSTFTATGISFAAITAVCSQLAAYSSTANGLAFAVLGFAFLMAGAGYAEGSWLSWLSPIGWPELTYVYTPEQRWWPLVFAAAVSAALAWLAFALVAKRDFGAGMLTTRPGRAFAKPGLRSATALTFRLTKGMLWTAVISMLLLGLAYGSVIGSADQFLDSMSETQQEVFTRGSSAPPEDSFAVTVTQVQAYIALIFALLVIGRARKEETGGRGELLGSSPVARSGWPGSYFVAAMVNGTVGTLVGGLTLALIGAASLGWDTFGKLTLASLNYLPAVWVVIAAAFALLGWVPRFGALRWLLWLYVFVIGYFGSIIEGMPEWVGKGSPFKHVAEYPLEDMDWPAVAALTAVAAGLAILGYVGIRRRDLHFS